MLIVKCCAKKNTRNKPESAMATLRAMVEEIIPIMVLFSEFYSTKIRFKLAIAKKMNL
jgi:hypothetical protein